MTAASQPPMALAQQSWPELASVLGDIELVLIPIGSTEQHGPNLGLGQDHLISQAFCELAAERLAVVRSVWPEVSLPPGIPVPGPGDAPDTRAEAVAAILRGVMDCSGPVSVQALAARRARRGARIEEGRSRQSLDG